MLKTWYKKLTTKAITTEKHTGLTATEKNS